MPDGSKRVKVKASTDGAVDGQRALADAAAGVGAVGDHPEARTLDQHLAADSLNTYVHSVTSAEFKRRLERQGATFEPAKGGHIWVMLRGRRAILPMHGSRREMKRGTVAAIKKQLGLE